MLENQATRQCVAYCLAQRFDIATLSKLISETTQVRIIKGSLVAEDHETLSVIFPYGAVVHWNVNQIQQNKLHQLLLNHAEHPLESIEEDHFTYTLGCSNTRIIEDHIEIESADPILIFSLSHGMAQSIKLATFETNAITTINKTNYLPKSLAENGKIILERNALAKIRGQLFLTKSDIILNYDLLDTPDFFWEYPEYESYYSIAAKYLEISQRIEVLSKKLETIHELFEMLADEQRHRQSSRLEWIIIWLITLEISLTLFDKIF
ncbi:MAG: RMD1 family protein [Methylococcaceae bacterium]|jgi:uncharacterized Rmd1/YagE family protein